VPPSTRSASPRGQTTHHFPYKQACARLGTAKRKPTAPTAPTKFAMNCLLVLFMRVSSLIWNPECPQQDLRAQVSTARGWRPTMRIPGESTGSEKSKKLVYLYSTDSRSAQAGVCRYRNPRRRALSWPSPVVRKNARCWLACFPGRPLISFLSASYSVGFCSAAAVSCFTSMM